MKCINCEFNNQNDAIFCKNCGIKIPEQTSDNRFLEMFCIYCGEKNIQEARYCNRCGKAINATPTGKQMASTQSRADIPFSADRPKNPISEKYRNFMILLGSASFVTYFFPWISINWSDSVDKMFIWNIEYDSEILPVALMTIFSAVVAMVIMVLICVKINQFVCQPQQPLFPRLKWLILLPIALESINGFLICEIYNQFLFGDFVPYISSKYLYLWFPNIGFIFYLIVSIAALLALNAYNQQLPFTRENILSKNNFRKLFKRK